jgi:hypothetical protein
MTRASRRSPLTAVLTTCALLAAGAASAAPSRPDSPPAPKFLADDPIRREPDPADASKVQPFPVHLTWDLVSSLFAREGHPSPTAARDVNTVDEVPDSSWFTNRAGARALTAADVARGPDTTDGPAGRWTVVSGKSEGVRPGFTVRDDAGITWFVKFDAPGYPEQATGAEAVATRLFWALGYNVAETHVAAVRRDQLALAPTATITVQGRKRALTSGDVDRVLARAERAADGSYRALASRALEGKPIGEFLYYGTRSDDPNDTVPHEDRRELRGMGVFAAWIDRVDAKAGNTLDTLVTADGRTVVRHHVMDFGSTLGSAGIGPNEAWEGFEYLYDGKPLAKKALGFGFPIEPWRRIEYPALRGIGRIEGDHFVPDEWRSRVPNAAYLRADAGDRFWAARKLAAITDDLIAAAVRSGRYSDPHAADYLTGTLIKRRDAILRAYLPAVNPVSNAALDFDGELTILNAATHAGVAAAPAAYRAEWFAFDNETQAARAIGSTHSEGPVLRAPATIGASTAFLRSDISAVAADHPGWARPVSAYFRRQGEGWTLVGLERPAPPAIDRTAPRTVRRSVPITLHGRTLDLHLEAPQGTPASDVLVLYASGDGGWFGAAVDMFRHIASSGYYAVGFSSKQFMKIDRPKHLTLNPEQVAAEYTQIVDAARNALQLPSTTPVLLTGWSRGAALSVLAASARSAPPYAAGVVAIGLAEGEDLKIDGPADESDEAVVASGERRWPYDPYAILNRLSVPCAVIQASKDPYLSAARARMLFGDDTAERRFFAVDARNHRFTGGKDAFNRALGEALAWEATWSR